MLAGLILSVTQVAEATAFLFVSGRLIDGLIAIQVAVALALVTVKIPPREGMHWAKLTRAAAILGMFPAIWIAIQAVPAPMESWTNSISSSAATPLGGSVSGSLSIDPGASLIALCRYLAGGAIVLLVAAVTIERQGAVKVLTALAAAASVAAAISLGYTAMRQSGWMGPVAPGPGAMSAASGVGMVLVVGAGFGIFERYGRKRGNGVNRTKLLAGIGLCLMAFGLCTFSVILLAGAEELFSSICGISLLVLIMITRQFSLRRWEVATIGFAGCIFALALIGLRVHNDMSQDWTLRFATNGDSASMTIMQRMMADAPVVGIGAGTYESLLPIYRSSREVGEIEPPTSAAVIALELGRPALLIIVGFVALLIGILVRGSMSRGRDAFFSATGAGCLVALTIGAFQNTGLLYPTIWIWGASILGLGIAQTAGRSVR